MLGTRFRLTPLELRKQLLLAESEVNRAQLVVEAERLRAELDEFRGVVDSALSLTGFVRGGLETLHDLWKGGRERGGAIFSLLGGFFDAFSGRRQRSRRSRD